MIDWFGVFANFLWVLGLAIALAAFSYASWQASVTKEKTFTVLKQPNYLVVFSIAAIFFCAGLAATSDAIWEIAIWSIMGIVFLVQAILIVRAKKEVEGETKIQASSDGETDDN